MKSASDPTKTMLVAGCAVAVACAMVFLVIDPTKGLQSRLDDLPQAHGLALPVSKKPLLDIAGLVERPIFVMTTGPGAYKDKTLQLFGLAISPGRKAALVSVDGAAATWMAVGDSAGDLRLVDVGTNGARFDTPIGPRTVGLNDAVPAKPAAAGTSPNAGTMPAPMQPPQGG